MLRATGNRKAGFLYKLTERPRSFPKTYDSFVINVFKDIESTKAARK
jgi:hypothetical protein